MPNIIEQQDLLKGLPDTRLMTLLQNPVGDIPPFLVAAEAQRRQQIRQQFAGSGSKESVVDTLTKQLANVPQNVNAPARTPPTIPQTPQMQGVMALQQQQAMTDIAQQAQPQTMRSGGMVQRYQSQGLVQRMGELYGSRSPTVQQLSSMTPEELAALRKYQSDQNMKRLNEQAQITGGRYGQGMAYQRELLENRLSGPFAGFSSPESTVEAAKKLQDLPSEEEMNRTLDTGKSAADPYRQAYESGYRGIGPMPAAGSAARPPKPTPRPEDLVPQKEGETADEYRDRLEELLAAQQPSDWEKAQGYFAMAEQFLDPSKTTMQSLVGAGQAFAQSAAERDRAQREAELSLKKGLLEYDMSQAAERSAAARAERERTTFSAKDQADILVKRSESLARMISEKERQVAEMTSDPLSTNMDPTLQNRIAALKKEIENLYAKKDQVDGSLSTLGESAYGPIPFDTYSLNSGFRI
jgi:uncharacterized small protein (DUF1192 family)